MKWHPTLTVHSERSAWRQVVRGLVTFSVGAVVIVGLLIATGWAKGAWDRRQEARAERAAIASLGLRRICVGDNVNRDCLHRAADTAGATVVSVPGASGDLLVSAGPRSADARFDAAPLSYNAMAFRYAALEELSFGAPHGLNYDLISGPRSAPGAGYRRTARVTLQGVDIDVYVLALGGGCGCGHGPWLRKVWATWHLDGQAYAAWFVLGEGDGTPAAFLDAVLARVAQIAPTRQV